jgi:hypothetical protein
MADDIIQHYTEVFDEESRLDDRVGPFEYERTKSIITRYLDRKQQIIVDAGGGSGVTPFGSPNRDTKFISSILFLATLTRSGRRLGSVP